jgi:hypothetical protein
VVLYAGKGIGWVHAINPMEAIRRVAVMTGKPADECAALLFEVRPPNSSKSDRRPAGTPWSVG